MTIGIYGLGRFGSFYASLLSRAAEVKAWSRDPARPAPPGVERVGEEELLGLPVVVLCVSISAMREVLARIGPRLAAGALVMDTCSVKEAPVAGCASCCRRASTCWAPTPCSARTRPQGAWPGCP